MASQNRAIVDKLLSNVSSAYMPQGLVGDKLLPFIGVKQSSGLLGKYGTRHLAIENSVKVGKSKYRQVEPIVRTSTSYLIRGHGLEGIVTKDDYRNVESPFKAEQDETMGLTNMIMLEKEKILADALTSTSVLTQNATLSGTDQWSDYSNSRPMEKVSDCRMTIADKIGILPNKIVCDMKVAEKLRYHPQLLDALGFKYARPGGLSDSELASAFNVDQFIVAQGRYESANEGASSSMAPIWGKDMVIMYSPNSAQPYQASLGYRLGFEGQDQRKVYKYAINNPPESTGILVEDEYQHLVSDVNCGYLLKAVIA